ncbi:hypothetical protein CDG81_05225 [Actinopolyspora erythraea]|uniref:Uncharacterized protein n=1 Tax=Actinopolyspora erythraea TaxID=414996 RepID=A0A099D3Z6_9ACTN|nr:hypothetical protein [Actinopolyspora erythraea]ASU77808.1 hypothetical protein CDG81_05225 [Actinopolyspora erythraea]KGI80025.1 hypothetical protein IL38_20215 [Actinopolyspora erythraea]
MEQEVQRPQYDLGQANAARLTPSECSHPRERVRWLGDFTGPFDQWVFQIDCLRCGGSWDHDSRDRNAPWEQVTQMLDEGRFSKLYSRIGPVPDESRAAAAVTAHTSEILHDLRTMGAVRFPID